MNFFKRLYYDGVRIGNYGLFRNSMGQRLLGIAKRDGEPLIIGFWFMTFTKLTHSGIID